MSFIKTSILLSYICVASISAAIITPALPQIKAFFTLGHGMLEWVISLYLCGYVIGQLIYGPLANRFGRLSALRSGLVVNLIGIIICLVAVRVVNYQLLLFGRLITALGAAAGLSCTFILINELLNEEHAKRAMSFTTVAFTVGVGLAVSLGGVVTQYWHWQLCFWILLAHGIAMLACTWLFPETLTQRTLLHPGTIVRGYVAALKSLRLVIPSLAVAILSVTTYCYSAAAPIYSQSVLKLTPDLYGYWNGMTMLGMLGSGFLSANLLKKYSAQRVLLLSMLLLIPCIASLCGLANSSGNTLWFFATMLLLCLFGGVVFSAASYLASNAIADKANASSMMSFINMSTAMLAVIILGYLPQSVIVGFALVLSGYFIFILTLVLIFLSISRHK